MALIELLLLLLLSAVGLGWIARRFQFPYPIALVAGGALLVLIPNLPQYAFDPNLLLVAVLPPHLGLVSIEGGVCENSLLEREKMRCKTFSTTACAACRKPATRHMARC